jgi:hypothetical protein
VSTALLLGPVACLGSAALWALAANVYARVSRDSGPMAVNFMRAALSFPLFLAVALASGPARGLALVTPGRAGWLLLSIVGSYLLGDALFLASTRSLGVPAALTIASIYPLWSAFAGWAFLAQSVGGAGLAGVVAVIAGRSTEPDGRSPAGEAEGSARKRSGRVGGVFLALATSFLWELNTFAVTKGGEGVPHARWDPRRHRRDRPPRRVRPGLKRPQPLAAGTRQGRPESPARRRASAARGQVSSPRASWASRSS